VKTFDNEWIFDAFAGHPGFFTKGMFGGLAAYAHERMMLILVEPTRTGRWKWHGVLVCTGFDEQPSIRRDFPALTPHDVLRKWLWVDSTHADFEQTMEAVARCMARNDPRFGIVPRPTASGKTTSGKTRRRWRSRQDSSRGRTTRQPAKRIASGRSSKRARRKK
jgi:hypothetical protein